MFVLRIVLTLLFLEYSRTAVIVTKSSNKILKLSKTYKGEYFPGIHSSINASDVVFSYNELDESGKFA